MHFMTKGRHDNGFCTCTRKMWHHRFTLCVCVVFQPDKNNVCRLCLCCWRSSVHDGWRTSVSFCGVWLLRRLCPTVSSVVSQDHLSCEHRTSLKHRGNLCWHSLYPPQLASLIHLCVFQSDIADADSSPMKGVDFHIDPEATPSVRSLRSQSFHTSSGTWTLYQHGVLSNCGVPQGRVLGPLLFLFNSLWILSTL